MGAVGREQGPGGRGGVRHEQRDLALRGDHREERVGVQGEVQEDVVAFHQGLRDAAPSCPRIPCRCVANEDRLQRDQKGREGGCSKVQHRVMSSRGVGKQRNPQKKSIVGEGQRSWGGKERAQEGGRERSRNAERESGGGKGGGGGGGGGSLDRGEGLEEGCSADLAKLEDGLEEGLDAVLVGVLEDGHDLGDRLEVSEGLEGDLPRGDHEPAQPDVVDIVVRVVQREEVEELGEQIFHVHRLGQRQADLRGRGGSEVSLLRLLFFPPCTRSAPMPLSPLTGPSATPREGRSGA